MQEHDDLPFIDPDDRPEEVPDHFVKVPADECGYAITDGDIWVARVGEDEYGNELMVRLADNSDGPATTAIVATRAINSDPEVPSALKKAIVGGWLHGEYPDLVFLRDALKHYENHGAGIGEDKTAYDIRTTLNHASRAVMKRTAPHSPL